MTPFTISILSMMTVLLPTAVAGLLFVSLRIQQEEAQRQLAQQSVQPCPVRAHPHDLV